MASKIFLLGILVLCLGAILYLLNSTHIAEILILLGLLLFVVGVILSIRGSTDSRNAELLGDQKKGKPRRLWVHLSEVNSHGCYVPNVDLTIGQSDYRTSQITDGWESWHVLSEVHRVRAPTQMLR